MPKVAKKVKDANAPKRPMSSFMLFANDHREKVKAANPSATFGEIGKLLGSAWKEANEKVKAEYQEKAVKAKAKYEVAKAAYEKTPKSE